MKTESQKAPPRLGALELFTLLRGSSNPEYFNKKVRPMLYKKCGNDPEAVHDLVLSVVRKNGYMYERPAGIIRAKAPDNLMVTVNGARVLLFGTAAGMDKDLEALHAFGSTFGFQVPGTVVITPREGNPRTRLATIEETNDLVNAQGFPSRGLKYALRNISEYRRHGSKGIVYASICGLPGEGEDAINKSITEVETLASSLGPYVNGFVWNPYSPNTAALARLREPSVFCDTAKAMRKHAGGKLLLVKIGPYGSEDREGVFKLINGFMEGGGNGIATTNTKMVKKEELPERIRNTWGYSSAGRSGRFLSEYRIRSVKDMRRRFPSAVIAATGGIFSGEDAFSTFCAGATFVEGYTSYTYFGTGLAKEIMEGVSAELKKRSMTLESLQNKIMSLAAEGNSEELDRIMQGDTG